MESTKKEEKNNGIFKNGFGWNRKRSLTRQMILIISGLVALAIIICWVLNITVLENFYIRQKVKDLRKSYNELSLESQETDLGSDDFDLTFEKLTSSGNLRILIVSSSGEVVRSSEENSETMLRDFSDILFDEDVIADSQVIDEEGDYSILRSRNPRMDDDYLVLWGTLDSGDLILIRTPLASIRESVQISNKFFLMIGIIVILLSMLMALIVSRKITRPIMQLTDISEQMVDLNFEAKYQRGAWKHKKWREIRKIREEWSKKQQTHGDDSLPADKIRGKRVYTPGTEVDQLGDHINRLSDALEQTISELKSANLELQSDIAKKIEIDEMRKEFLSNVSHELKTPLALIQGYAEGLQECINDDQESRDFYCIVIMEEAEKMNRMVRKLLTLNQLEFGNDQVDMERFDITELIHGVANATQILMEQDEITLSLEITETKYVWGDEFKVEEVITNYLSNAIHHCSGAKQIRIFYTECEGNRLRVSVFNTGHNIPAEDLENIWVRFYKVDKAHTRAYGGSGIGLSIVKAIMDSMGQKCGVINHPDGVEFWFELDEK